MQSKGIKLNSKSRGGAHANGPAAEMLSIGEESARVTFVSAAGTNKLGVPF